MNPGETIIDDALANELIAAKRTLGLARFRLNQDRRVFVDVRSGQRPPRVGDRALEPHLGRDRDLWRRHQSALRRVRHLESLTPDW